MKSICPITSDPKVREAAEKIATGIGQGFPAGVSRPALLALAAAGLHSLQDLNGFSKTALLAMHGIGPKAARLLETGLMEMGGNLSK
jgi:hypothetical protein